MADRLAGGKLEAILRDHVAEGRTLDAITVRLYAEQGIEVTRQTVANWLKLLDIRRPSAEEPAARATDEASA